MKHLIEGFIKIGEAISMLFFPNTIEIKRPVPRDPSDDGKKLREDWEKVVQDGRRHK